MRRIIIILAIVDCFSAGATIAYVKQNATGLNNGTSWANAYVTMDSVISTTIHTIDTVWVANGVYKHLNASGNGIPFIMNSQFTIYGGFVGTETSISQRNLSAFLTVLDGDTGFPGVKTDNPSCVIDCAIGLAGQKFVLDGFKITNAYGEAGILVVGYTGVTHTIANCLIINNESTSTQPYHGGGGITIGTNGTVNIINCIFENNKSGSFGGALRSNSNNNSPSGLGSVNITGCTFLGNTAANGGAVVTTDTVPVIINRCIFKGNTATNAGGAIYDSVRSRVKVYNSLIIGNKAATGGAYFTPPYTAGFNRPHTLIHTTVAHNIATSTASTDYSISLRSTDTIKNCIIWGNTTGSGAQIPTPGPSSAINTNIIQGASFAAATNTYTFDPQFAGPGTAAMAPFPIAGVYNYRLKALSAAVDTGLALGLTVPLNRDLDSAARVFGLHPDLGAYENAYCSRSMTLTASGPTTFCQPDSVILTATGGFNNVLYQWHGGSLTGNPIVAKVSGVYKVLTMDSNNCRGSMSITINAIPVPAPTITVSGNTLSVPAVYATYQWYQGSTLIAGATSASYLATTNGLYKVEVTTVTGGCKGTSMIYNLKLGVSNTLSEGVKVYPNPAKDILILEGLKAGTIVSIQSIVGQAMLSFPILSNRQQVNISALAPGTYLLLMRSEGATSTARLTKE